MSKIKVMTVFGTRPEAIKMAPLALRLKASPEAECLVCVTGQHREMLDGVLSAFGIEPDYDLDIMRRNQSLTDITVRTLRGMEKVLRKARPDIVLVHGDTSTTFAAALAAFYQKISVGHVEAGLRTYDRYSPFPEEMNRTLTGDLADMHFAPTELNRRNLLREGVRGDIYVTGNTVIDSLAYTVRDDYVFDEPALREGWEGRTILVTAHRRENYGQPLRNIMLSLRTLVEEYPDLRIVYPVHLSPVVQETAHEVLDGVPRVLLIPPVGVFDMHNLMARSYMVMTDSGGLQEEAPALGRPVLVLRRETERPEAVEAGTVKVAGTEVSGILSLARRLLDDNGEYTKMARAVNPYGDGRASERIVKAILEKFM
ncbi:MAG: non-hydrolyzing UDP-N-acetylglucosamine 2-epimerase [Oscillospiraceae bacterium]|jgi:UDP-N-acetylglucosamine 2-epimerase (non-hydrolysing)